MFALSNGVLVSDKTNGGKRTLHWRLDVPHSCYLITLAVGDFATIETKWRDMPVVYYVERGREADGRAHARAHARRCSSCSRTKFGVPYPYPRYAQVFVADFIFGGMENTSATTLTDTVLLDERAAIDYDVDALVAHELAHQWFGDLVTCRDWGEGWLNEGFATYSEYIWREHHEGRDAADLELEEWADAYFGEDAGRYRRTIATKLYDEPIDIFDHHLYEKGGRVLHMLRARARRRRVLASARALPRASTATGVVESRDLARAVEDATGKNVDWFFSQWVIDGAGPPRARGRRSAGTPRRSSRRVTVEQTQKVEGAHAAVPAADEDAVPGRRRATSTCRSRSSSSGTCSTCGSTASRRRRSSIPGRVVLAARKIDKPEPMWIAELAGATLAIDRAAAAQALAQARRPGGRAGARRRRSRRTSSGRCAAPRRSALGDAAHADARATG